MTDLDPNKNLTYPGGLTRLFVGADLTEGATIALDDAQCHYLAHVMRARVESRVRVFNGRDGEWLCRITAITKRGVTLEAISQSAPQILAPDIWLLFAPIKKTPLDYVVQKATELGVCRLAPILTERTIVTRINLERMRANAVEAAEQSGRTCIPEIEDAVPLSKVILGWDKNRALIFCDESGKAPPIAKALAGVSAAKLGLLTGPEGGFSAAERQRIAAIPGAIPVSLGPRIMRADTAALGALAILQSQLGDWR